MKATSKLAAAAALFFGLAVAAMADPTLTVGSPAPAIKVARWVKGKPVKAFEKGKVYVVEFWATWCGPCKVSIPHLTELAKKYSGKATFVGVSMAEKNVPLGADSDIKLAQATSSKTFANYGDRVAAFVKDFGDKMNYNVCWEGDEAVMAKTWMQAAGQGGIPTAFVVDQDSKVVWIGHPMNGLDEVVGQVIDGKFDAKAEAAKAAKANEEQTKAMAKVTPFLNLLRQSKFAEAVDAMDKAFADDPSLEKGYGMAKFMALTNVDMAKANDYARKLAEGVYKDEPSALNSLAWTMVDDKKPLKGAEPKVAIEIAEKGVAATKDGDPTAAYILDTLAFAYFKDGQLDKALAYQEKALKSADSTSNFDPATRKEIADRYEMYKAKKNGGG